MIEVINKIEKKMIELLDSEQMKKLHEILINNLSGLSIYKEKNEKNELKLNYCDKFICAKSIEGCSNKSIKYYKSTIENMLNKVNKSIKDIKTEDLRWYLAEYSLNHKCSNFTIDNIRRIISSFFSWLEEEDYILIGKKLNINKVHPHKFRRTLATRAIDKGMPIEQVQQLLGHTKIDTTLQYAMVNQINVKNSHRRFVG